MTAATRLRWPPSWWPFPRPNPPKPPDPPPPTYTVRVEVFEGDPAADEKIPGAEVSLGDHQPILADGAGNAHIPDVLAGTYPLTVGAAGYSTVAAQVVIPTAAIQVSLDRVLPPWVPLASLTTDRQIFRHRGQPWRYIGATAFNFIDALAKGWDPAPFLASYAGTAPGEAGGITIIRSFCYTPVKDWGAAAWGWPTPTDVLSALSLLDARGLRMELTLLTDDDPANIPIAADLVRALALVRPANLLIEIANEPETNGKHTDTAALRSTLDQSGFLYSSGNYEDSRHWFGRYYTCHTGRTHDWPRRAHDLMEFYNGTGPDRPTVRHPVPCVGDEPGKVQDIGAVLKDWRAYFGGCALFGAGATIHLETGKLCQVPTSTEQSCIQAALDGLYAFPGEAPFGPYRKIDEPGNEPGGPTEDSRTYVIGGYAVRSQQVGNRFPEPGWVSLDPDGVLWRKA